MELELYQTQLRGYETVLDTTVFHEETLESIVPDACPDMLRILDTEGSICLRSKEPQDGRVEISGMVRATVLYLPDGAEGVRKLEVSIPFTAMADSRGVSGACHVVVLPRISSAVARSLNPRKVLLKVNLEIGLQVFSPIGESVGTSIHTAETAGVEQMVEEEQTYIPVCVQEKPFTFSDNLAISGSRPEMDEILKTRLHLACTESKIIGNKLIFKGDALLHLLYRAPDDALCIADYELPFSQIMEVSGGGEDANCDVLLFATSGDYHLGSDSRTLNVSLGILAQAVVREHIPMELLTDAYSTQCRLETETQPCHLHRHIDQGSKHQMGRILMEMEPMAKEVWDTYVELGTLTQSRDGKTLTLTQETQVTALYLSEDDQLMGSTQSLPISCELDLPEGCHCACRCRCPSEITATVTSGGLEVRFTLEFMYLVEETHKMEVISGVNVAEQGDEGETVRPSIVLRMAGREERLWDIAKSYGTTVADIRSANDLGDEMTQSQLLLIPRKR